MRGTSESVRSDDREKLDLGPTSSAKELISVLMDPDVDRLIQESRPMWRADAQLVGVAERTMETQVRLHLPALSRAMLTAASAREIYERVRVQAIVRSAEIGLSSVDAAYEAHLSMLVGGNKIRRDLTFDGDDGYRLLLHCDEVSTRAGQFVQSRLHYLRGARSDTSFEFGIFAPGAAMPMAYAAFSPVDRRYVLDALDAVGLETEPSDALVLTRMHGLPGIPRNTMSLMLGRAFRRIRDRRLAKYVITAFNPMLGFHGTTFQATGFTPFALAPVVYNYDDNGFFSTRRLGRGRHPQRLDVPENLLLIGGVTRDAKRILARRNRVICTIPRGRHREGNVPHKHFDPYDQECVKRLVEYRRTLQQAWSARTVHPRYKLEYDDPADPRGQCGVASVWLARALRHEFGIESTYCYGHLRTTNSTIAPVEHHCWVEIGDASDPRRTVIDLTSDQAAGMEGPVLCGAHAALVDSGLNYECVSRLRLDELPKDRVWRRFIVLDDEGEFGVNQTP